MRVSVVIPGRFLTDSWDGIIGEVTTFAGLPATILEVEVLDEGLDAQVTFDVPGLTIGGRANVDLETLRRAGL